MDRSQGSQFGLNVPDTLLKLLGCHAGIITELPAIVNKKNKSFFTPFFQALIPLPALAPTNSDGLDGNW